MPVKKAIYRWVFGFKISKSARIGFSFINTKSLEMEDGSRIGHFSFFRDLQKIQIGVNARIGNFNWFTHQAKIFTRHRSAEDIGAIILEAESAITNRHYIDVQKIFKLGRYSIMAGVGTTVLGHEIDFQHSCQTIASVHIGSYSFVGSNSVVLAGSAIGDRVIIGAGSVVRGANYETAGIYGGVPAKLIRSCPDDLGYFIRKTGYIN